MIDGEEVPDQGWGTQQVPMHAGRHRVEVWVPYVMPRRAGRARTDVTVIEGERNVLEYMAPSVTFARGSLGVPASSGPRVTPRS